jgi:hypothetical protein
MRTKNKMDCMQFLVGDVLLNGTQASLPEPRQCRTATDRIFIRMKEVVARVFGLPSIFDLCSLIRRGGSMVRSMPTSRLLICLAHKPPRRAAQSPFSQSPIDTLVNIKIRSLLCCQIPVRLAVHPVIHLRDTTLPQRWPACRAMTAPNARFGAAKSLPAATAKWPEPAF